METDGTNVSAPANLKINQMFGVKTGKRKVSGPTRAVGHCV